MKYEIIYKLIVNGSLFKIIRCNWCWELIVINIFDKDYRPVDGVERDEKYGNENFASGLDLEKQEK